MRMPYFLFLVLLSLKVFADLLPDSSLFWDEPDAGESNPTLLSNDEWLTLFFA